MAEILDFADDVVVQLQLDELIEADKVADVKNVWSGEERLGGEIVATASSDTESRAQSRHGQLALRPVGLERSSVKPICRPAEHTTTYTQQVATLVRPSPPACCVRHAVEQNVLWNDKGRETTSWNLMSSCLGAMPSRCAKRVISSLSTSDRRSSSMTEGATASMLCRGSSCGATGLPCFTSWSVGPAFRLPNVKSRSMRLSARFQWHGGPSSRTSGGPCACAA